jgi:hypothetical protein
MEDLDPSGEPPPLSSLDLLFRLETDCRKALVNDPCDLNKRLELAWTLFVQGAVSSGQEATARGASDQAEYSNPHDWNDQSDPPVLRSREFFRAALRETISVEHLGREEHLQVELNRLNTLIGALAGPDLIRERARRSVHIRMRLLEDLASRLDDGSTDEDPSDE